MGSSATRPPRVDLRRVRRVILRGGDVAESDAAAETIVLMSFRGVLGQPLLWWLFLGVVGLSTALDVISLSGKPHHFSVVGAIALSITCLLALDRIWACVRVNRYKAAHLRQFDERSLLQTTRPQPWPAVVSADVARPAQGWCPDHYRLHEQRWYSAGLPTALVRDGQVQSHDSPPDGEDSPGPFPEA